MYLLLYFSCEYLYKDEDDKLYAKPTRINANLYCTLSLGKIESLIDDTKIFPTSKSIPFPKNFLSCVKNIFKWILRIYAHLMKDHWKDIVNEKFEAEISSSFKHFIHVLAH